MVDYLRCLRRLRGMNDVECRMMAKDYLKCRMDQYVLWRWSDHICRMQVLIRALHSNLMAPDEFRNLGFADEEKSVEAIPGHAGGATAHKVRDDGKKIS